MQTKFNELAVPYQVFSATLEPEEDLWLHFVLQKSDTTEVEDCGRKRLTVDCPPEAIDSETIEAILYWETCQINQFELAPENIVLNADLKIKSISFYIDEPYLENVNKFRLVVIVDGDEPYLISKGKVYLEL